MRMRSAIIGVAGLALLAMPARLPAQGGTDFLKVVPEDALGFAVVRQIGAVSGKGHALAKLVNAPIPAEPLSLIKLKLGVDRGLDEKGDLVAVFLAGDGEPAVVVLVPVANYKEFLAPLKPKDAGALTTQVTVPGGEELHAGRKGNYAALSSSKGALQKVLASTRDASAGLAPLQAWLESNDLAAVLPSTGVKIIGARMRQALDQFKQAAAGLPPEVQSVAAMIDALQGLLKSSETDITHLAVGVQVDKANNVKLSARALFARGSGFARGGAALPALEGGPLAGLPAGPFVMAAGGLYPESSAQSLTAFSVELIKSAAKDLPKDKAKKLDEAYAQLAKGMRSMTMVWGSGKANDSMFGGVVGVVKVDDAAAYLASYEKSLRTTNDLLKDLNLPLGEYEIKKKDLAGTPVIEVTTDLAQAIPGGGGPQQKQLLELMFGKDGKMTITLAAADAKTVLMRYTLADGMKELLANYRKKSSGLADDPDIARAIGQLPPGAQWVLFISPQGVMSFTGRMLAAAGGGLQIPAFPKTPPVGLGVKLSAAGLEVQLVVPAAVLEGIGGITRNPGQGGV